MNKEEEEKDVISTSHSSTPPRIASTNPFESSPYSQNNIPTTLHSPTTAVTSVTAMTTKNTSNTHTTSTSSSNPFDDSYEDVISPILQTKDEEDEDDDGNDDEAIMQINESFDIEKALALNAVSNIVAITSPPTKMPADQPPPPPPPSIRIGIGGEALSGFVIGEPTIAQIDVPHYNNNTSTSNNSNNSNNSNSNNSNNSTSNSKPPLIPGKGHKGTSNNNSNNNNSNNNNNNKASKKKKKQKKNQKLETDHETNNNNNDNSKKIKKHSKKKKKKDSSNNESSHTSTTTKTNQNINQNQYKNYNTPTIHNYQVSTSSTSSSSLLLLLDNNKHNNQKKKKKKKKRKSNKNDNDYYNDHHDNNDYHNDDDDDDDDINCNFFSIFGSSSSSTKAKSKSKNKNKLYTNTTTSNYDYESILPIQDHDQNHDHGGNEDHDHDAITLKAPRKKSSKHSKKSTSKSTSKSKPKSTSKPKTKSTSKLITTIAAASTKFKFGYNQRPNTGELNSALGEGTTIHQILFKIRIITFILSFFVYIFEGWAIIGHVLFLNTPRIVLGCYLLFFVFLLCAFELVRGTPKVITPIDIMAMANGNGNGNNSGSGMQNNIQHQLLNEGLNKTAGEAINQTFETVWEVVIEQRFTRRIRYFLQSNFGILYSCTGRAIYLCFVGGLALGEGLIFMEIIGILFVIMGIWMLTLGFRFPALDRTLVMDSLEYEFGSQYNTSSDGNSVNGGGGSGSVITWSSVASKSANGGETRSLINNSSR